VKGGLEKVGPSKYLRVVQILLLSIGAIFILLSAWVAAGSAWERIFLSLGIVLTASTLLALLNSILGSDVRAVVEETVGYRRQLQEMGLKKVHLHVGDETILENFEDAHSIDMMYNSAKNTCHRFGDKIATAVIERGCTVRLLIADPNNIIWKSDQIRNGLCPGTDVPQEIREVLAHFKYLFEELREHPAVDGGSIEVRQYSCAPTGSILIVDGSIARHTPYLPYSHSTEVPMYDVIKQRTPGLFDKYQAAFNRVWKCSQPVFHLKFPASEMM